MYLVQECLGKWAIVVALILFHRFHVGIHGWPGVIKSFKSQVPINGINGLQGSCIQCFKSNFDQVAFWDLVSLSKVFSKDLCIVLQDQLFNLGLTAVLEKLTADHVVVEFFGGSENRIRIAMDEYELCVGKEFQKLFDPAGIMRIFQEQGSFFAIEGDILQKVQIITFPL